MQNHASNFPLGSLTISPELKQVIKRYRNELVDQLVTLTPDPSNPATLFEISTIQGTIKAYDAFLEFQEEVLQQIETNKEVN